MSILTDALLRRGYEEVSPGEFYREIFPDGELEEAGVQVPGKYNAIAVEITREKKPDGSSVVRRHTVTDDLDKIDELMWGNNFCILSPVSYAGKSRDSKNARFMYALCIELDNLVVKKGEQTGLDALISLWTEPDAYIPKPTFTVASGNGLHLYYQFPKPVPMFPNIVKEMKLLKRELTTKIWNRRTTTTYKKGEVQQESIFQGFRMVGSITKNGDRVTAHRTGDRVSLEQLNQFVKPANQVTVVYKTNLPLAKAKKLYPEWYERRVVQKQPKGSWATNRAVYDWWKRRVAEEARVGHRYYCLMMLVIYAIKCGNYHPKKNPNPVTREELESDLMELMHKLDDPTNRLTEKDVVDALQAYDDRELFTYPVASIADRSGIEVVANLRHRRPQAEHLEEARALRDIRMRRQGRKWDDGNGRKPGQSRERDAVIKWRQEHPEGRKADCIRELGFSKPTVYRWWDAEPEKNVVQPDDELAAWEATHDIDIVDTRSYLDALIAEAEAMPTAERESTKRPVKEWGDDLPF